MTEGAGVVRIDWNLGLREIMKFFQLSHIGFAGPGLTIGGRGAATTVLISNNFAYLFCTNNKTKILWQTVASKEMLVIKSKLILFSLIDSAYAP